jgi:hypothetical protein
VLVFVVAVAAQSANDILAGNLPRTGSSSSSSSRIAELRRQVDDAGLPPHPLKKQYGLIGGYQVRFPCCVFRKKKEKKEKNHIHGSTQGKDERGGKREPFAKNGQRGPEPFPDLLGAYQTFYDRPADAIPGRVVRSLMLLFCVLLCSFVFFCFLLFSFVFFCFLFFRFLSFVFILMFADQHSNSGQLSQRTRRSAGTELFHQRAFGTKKRRGRLRWSRRHCARSRIDHGRRRHFAAGHHHLQRCVFRRFRKEKKCCSCFNLMKQGFKLTSTKDTPRSFLAIPRDATVRENDISVCFSEFLSATLDYPGIDVKFTNTFSKPVKIVYNWFVWSKKDYFVLFF